MTKPWEETWAADVGQDPMGDAYCFGVYETGPDGAINRLRPVVATEYEFSAEVGRFIASAPELYRLLADLLTHPMGLHPLAKPRVEAMLRKARGEEA